MFRHIKLHFSYFNVRSEPIIILWCVCWQQKHNMEESIDAKIWFSKYKFRVKKKLFLKKRGFLFLKYFRKFGQPEHLSA